MLLPRDSALRFIEGYKSVLLRVLAEAGIPRTRSITDDLATARTHAARNPGSIERIVDELQSAEQAIDPSVAAAIKSMQVGQWVYLRHTRTFAVFLDHKLENAYEVRALTTPLNELMDEPPFAFEAGLFEYEGLYVCDGLVLSPVMLGPGYTAQFKAVYTELRRAGRLHARVAA